MKDHDGTGNKIFSNQPPHVPNGRSNGVMRIGTTQNALVPMRSGKSELPGPCHTTGRAEQLRSCNEADRLLGLL